MPSDLEELQNRFALLTGHLIILIEAQAMLVSGKSVSDIISWLGSVSAAANKETTPIAEGKRYAVSYLLANTDRGNLRKTIAKKILEIAEDRLRCAHELGIR